MPIDDHLQEFAGKPVKDWEPDQGLDDPENTIAAIRLSYDAHDAGTKWVEKFETFLQHPDAAQVPGIVVGAWDFEFGNPMTISIVEAVAAAKDRLPNVKAIFFADLVMEESEISWIQQTDVTPILQAFPQLEHFGVRGGDGLQIGSILHGSLESLIVQTGGLDASVVQSIAKADFSSLEHLELWLGDSNYGATTTVEDLQPILNGQLFPELTYLGLRNSEMQDEIAIAVANAPVLQELEVLDLSMGVLTNEGAKALLASTGIKSLSKLVLTHHFCSAEVVEQLKALPIEVVIDKSQAADEYDGKVYRYVEVGE